MLDKLSHDQGLTLVELQVLVVILGGLSAITFPAFLNQKGRADIVAAQNTVTAAARTCAAAQITGKHAEWQEQKTANVVGTCEASGTLSTFTVAPEAFNLTTAPSATVASSGVVALTTCATAPGWSSGAASCLGGAGNGSGGSPGE